MAREWWERYHGCEWIFEHPKLTRAEAGRIGFCLPPVPFGLASVPLSKHFGRTPLIAKYLPRLTGYIMGWETHIQIAIAASTNLTLLPAIFYAYRRKQSFVFIISLMTLICSIGYHIADAWENPPLGA